MSKEKKPAPEKSDKKSKHRKWHNFFEPIRKGLSRAFRKRNNESSEKAHNRLRSQSLHLSEASSFGSHENIRPPTCSASVDQLRVNDAPSGHSSEVDINADVCNSTVPQNFKDVLNAKLGCSPFPPGSARRMRPSPRPSEPEKQSGDECGASDETGDAAASSPAGLDTSPGPRPSSVDSSPSMTDMVLSHRIGVNRQNRRPPTVYRASESVRQVGEGLESTDLSLFSRSPASPPMLLNRITEEADQEDAEVSRSHTTAANPSPADTVAEKPDVQHDTSLKQSPCEASSMECSQPAGGDKPLSPVAPPPTQDEPATESRLTDEHQPSGTEAASTGPPCSDASGGDRLTGPASTTKFIPHATPVMPVPTVMPVLRRVKRNQTPVAPSSKSVISGGADDEEEEEDISMSSVAKRASLFGAVMHPVQRNVEDDRSPGRRLSSNQNGTDSIHLNVASHEEEKNKRTSKVLDLVKTFQQT